MPNKELLQQALETEFAPYFPLGEFKWIDMNNNWEVTFANSRFKVVSESFEGGYILKAYDYVDYEYHPILYKGTPFIAKTEMEMALGLSNYQLTIILRNMKKQLSSLMG